MTEVQQRIVAATCPGQSWMQLGGESPHLTTFPLELVSPEIEGDQTPRSPSCLDFQPPPANAYMRLGALEAKISHNHETRDLRASLSAPVLGSRSTRRASYSVNSAWDRADHRAVQARLPAVLDKRNLTNEEILIEVENCKQRLEWLRRVSYLNSSDRHADDDNEATYVDGDLPTNPYLQMPSRHMSISEGELADSRGPDSALATSLAARYSSFKTDSRPVGERTQQTQHNQQEQFEHGRRSNLQRSVTLDRAMIKPHAAKKKRSLLQRMIKKITPKTIK